MPKSYRIVVTMVDEEGQEVASTTHDETYEDDQEAREQFEQKEQAARRTGKGRR